MEEKKIDIIDNNNNDIKAPEFNNFLESVELKNTNINKNEIDIKSNEAVTQSQILDILTKLKNQDSLTNSLMGATTLSNTVGIVMLSTIIIAILGWFLDLFIYRMGKYDEYGGKINEINYNIESIKNNINDIEKDNELQIEKQYTEFLKTQLKNK